jgi:hypothetical protein
MKNISKIQINHVKNLPTVHLLAPALVLPPLASPLDSLKCPTSVFRLDFLSPRTWAFRLDFWSFRPPDPIVHRVFYALVKLHDVVQPGILNVNDVDRIFDPWCFVWTLWRSCEEEERKPNQK